MPLKPGKAPDVNWLNSNQQTLYHDLDYSEEDINASHCAIGANLELASLTSFTGHH